MNISIEIELNEEFYTVEGYMIKGEDSTYDYPGADAELDCMTVYDEEGCDVTNTIDYPSIEYFEEKLFEYYQDNL
jgi:hypothetical protein